MKIYDISLPISPDIVVWPQSQAVKLSRVSDQTIGDFATVTELHMGVHTGTHVDAPLHFLQGGAAIESLRLEILCGPALVRHAPTVDTISADVFEQLSIPQGTERLLIRTRNSEFWKTSPTRFQSDFVAVSADGAQWLVDHQIKLIGIDYLSIAPFSDLTTTHQILLRADVILLEGLNLSHIAAGNYTLFCLPLNLLGSDGAPARTILTEEDGQ